MQPRFVSGPHYCMFGCVQMLIACMHDPNNIKTHLQPQMLKELENLHSFVLQGNSERHVFEAAPTCTGGKVFQNCHHQVCGLACILNIILNISNKPLNYNILPIR